MIENKKRRFIFKDGSTPRERARILNKSVDQDYIPNKLKNDIEYEQDMIHVVRELIEKIEVLINSDNPIEIITQWMRQLIQYGPEFLNNEDDYRLMLFKMFLKLSERECSTELVISKLKANLETEDEIFKLEFLEFLKNDGIVKFRRAIDSAEAQLKRKNEDLENTLKAKERADEFHKVHGKHFFECVEPYYKYGANLEEQSYEIPLSDFEHVATVPFFGHVRDYYTIRSISILDILRDKDKYADIISELENNLKTKNFIRIFKDDSGLQVNSDDMFSLLKYYLLGASEVTVVEVDPKYIKD